MTETLELLITNFSSLIFFSKSKDRSNGADRYNLVLITTETQFPMHNHFPI